MDKLMNSVSLKSLKDLMDVEQGGETEVGATSAENEEETKPKSSVVEKHPLLRSSSESSESSLEFDLDSSPKYKKKTNMPTKSSGTPGRFRDFMSTVTDEPTEGYYNTASSMWNNRAKIFTNLKKQATDKVQSLKNQNSFDTIVVSEDPETKPTPQENVDSLPPTKTNPTSTYSGLIKVETRDIQENKEDTEVDSFLQGLRGKVSDPLQSLLNLKQEEEEKRREWEEQEEFETTLKSGVKRHRSFTYTFDTRSENKESSQQISEPKQTPKKSDNLSNYKKSFAVSLSALLGGKSREEESESSEEEMEERVFEEKKEKVEEKISDGTEKVTQQISEPTPPSGDPPPSLLTILCCVFVVYFYFVYPVPMYALTVIRSFVSGVVFVSLFLCVFSPGSTQPKPFKLSYLNKTQPYEIPKSLYDPDQPLKGWMNEVFSYNSDTYHISHSQSVYITLDGSTLRLQTPFKNIPKKCLYNEGNIQLSNVIHQRLYDITFAKIYLRPPGLVKKRVWSKKYPICVEFPPKIDNDNSSEDDKNLSKENEIIFLFGRTDRQKEEWFYRLQRSINVCMIRHKASVKVLPPVIKTMEDDENNEQGWGLIDNHYEEDTYVASSVYNVEKINEDPLRAFQDYFVHVSRLFPDPKDYQAEKKDFVAKTPDSEGPESFAEPGLGVAWLNAALGRIMFDFLRQPSWARKVSLKIQKKLDKIRLPYFMDELKLTEMNLGPTVPLIHQISLPKLDAQGVWLEMEVTYTGSAQMTLKTKMVLTKLGKNEEKPPTVDTTFQPLSSAITDSDAEDSAESSDEDDDSTVYRMVNHVQTAVSRLDGPSLIKDTIKAVAAGNEPPPSSPNQMGASPVGAPPKKWLKVVDAITKSKYFQKATENDYIRRKLETVSNTPMLLTVEMLQLQGTLFINIPPPPTDRIWYGFKEPPHMLVKAHPKVGERVVKMSHITEWIEHKLKREFMKVLVLPNMDDIPFPIMFNNRPSS